MEDDITYGQKQENTFMGVLVSEESTQFRVPIHDIYQHQTDPDFRL